ncbi:hypothetical protein OPQ81_000116 [Rhizoctonia solani]|nr:hypothetical protein OPQ81_000116 [Rhizoctonia solani]
MYFQQQSPGQASLVNVPLSTSSSAPDLTGDQAFIGDVLKSIAARHGERVVRAKWRDWVAKFTRMAAAFEERCRWRKRSVHWRRRQRRRDTGDRVVQVWDERDPGRARICLAGRPVEAKGAGWQCDEDRRLEKH